MNRLSFPFREFFLTEIAAYLVSSVIDFTITPTKASSITRKLLEVFPANLNNDQFISKLTNLDSNELPEISKLRELFLYSIEKA